MVVEERRLVDKEVHDARFGVESDSDGQLGEHIFNVFMQQVEGANANADEHAAQKELVARNDDQPLSCCWRAGSSCEGESVMFSGSSELA